jgi:hypothetical protein
MVWKKGSGSLRAEQDTPVILSRNAAETKNLAKRLSLPEMLRPEFILSGVEGASA